MSRLNNSLGNPDGRSLLKGEDILKSRIDRRVFFKRSLVLAALANASISCKEDPSNNDNPPPPSEPVYELKFGPYDNLDGQGGHQDYDNTELAVAGQLSAQLWDHGPSSTVVDNPSGNLTVLNENFQSVAYGWEDREEQRIIQYLQENVRPVTYFEREQFEKFLNPKGHDLVARIEEKDIDKQHKILQYVFSNRKGLFNEKGTKLDEMMKEKNAQDFLTQDTLNELVETGFDENEVMALYYFHQEKQFYDGFLAKKVRDAGRKGINRVKTALGIETRIEPVEYKYTFDRKGNLIDAQPHIPGQPYHGAKKLMWVEEQGKIHATAQTVPGVYAQSASGYVVKMERETQGDNRLELNNQEDIEFKDYKSLSVDLRLNRSDSEEFSVGIDYHTSIPEQGGISWYSQMGLFKDPRAGFAYIFANIKNKNTDYQFWKNLDPMNFGEWYNLRMDIETKDDDPTLKDTEFRVKFYVNGVEKAAEIPEDSAILLDPNKTDFGPKRSVSFVNTGGKPIRAFADNFKAVYKNRVS